MRHPRVRRPFIVESRGSNRDGNSIAIPKRVPPTPRPQFKSDEAARPLFDPWAAVTTPAEPVTARRILPNIMTPPEPVTVEPEAEVQAAEPPLPRVRRVKPRAAPAPRPASVKAEVTIQAAPPASPAPIAMAAPPVAAETKHAAPRFPLRADRTGRAALPAGQRWKARLPRSCW